MTRLPMTQRLWLSLIAGSLCACGNTTDASADRLVDLLRQGDYHALVAFADDQLDAAGIGAPGTSQGEAYRDLWIARTEALFHTDAERAVGEIEQALSGPQVLIQPGDVLYLCARGRNANRPLMARDALVLARAQWPEVEPLGIALEGAEEEIERWERGLLSFDGYATPEPFHFDLRHLQPCPGY